MNGFGEIGRNDNFWAKMTIFGPKRGKFRFFGRNFLWPFFLRPKTEFLWEKSEKSYDWIWRNWPKWPFLGQNVNFWPFWGPKGEIEIFREEIFLAIFFKTKNWVYMRKIRKISWLELEKLDKMAVFGPKWQFLDRFWPKMAKTRFLAKKQNWHFLTFIEPGLHEKNQKNLMRGFLGNWWRTDGRTSVNP